MGSRTAAGIPAEENRPPMYYHQPEARPGFLATAGERSLLSRVLGWLGVSIALTATGTWLYATQHVFVPPLFALVLFIGGIFGINAAVASRRHALGAVLFGGFALLEGVFIGPLITTLLKLDPGAVYAAFFATVGIFVVCGAVVWSTSYNFAAWGKWLLGALLVAILVSVLSYFLPISQVLVSALMGVIFIGLVLFDFWRVRQRQALNNDSLVLALSLYLDFLNLFLIMLRLFSSRD